MHLRTTAYWCCAITFLSFCSVQSVHASAITASAVGDFPDFAALPAQSANGYWSYGYVLNLADLAGGITLHDTPVNVPTPAMSGFYTNAPDNHLPEVIKDFSGAPVNWGSITNWPDTYLLLHPGRLGAFSVVRFTAPSAGTYKIAGSYVGLDIGPTTTDVHVISNGTTELIGGNIDGCEFCGATPAGTNPMVSFDFSANLAAGGTIDFAVGFGTDLSFSNDSTGLSADITSAPEPAAALLIGAGLTALGIYRRRRLTGRS